jgi:chemotaxis protein histidine kinase CheA
MNTIAKTLGKPLPVLEISGDAWITSAAAEKMTEIIPHILANLMDHGIESPEERTLIGKPAQGLVYFEASSSPRMELIIDILDDGRGISLDQLREKALKKQLLPAAGIKQLPDDKVLEFLFHDGFSTKDSANLISGRGVGMSAIRVAMASIGGTATAVMGSKLPDDRLELILRLMIPDSEIWWLDSELSQDPNLRSA